MRLISKAKNAMSYPMTVWRLGAGGTDRSYYPEHPQKSTFARRLDLLKWMSRYGEVCENYYLWGLDLKDSTENWKQYQPMKEFIRTRNRMNHSPQTVLLRDKFLFFKYMSSMNMPVPEVFGLVKSGRLYNSVMDPIEITQIEQKADFFCKAINGECGVQVKHIRQGSLFNDYLKRIGYSDSILQERVVQHTLMDTLNPNAVNTIRIVTVNKGGTVCLFHSILRIGTAESKERDNTSQGGIAVGIHNDGRLYAFGLRKPEFGGKTSSHPDTGVVFSEFTIPYYQKAVDLCCAAHRLFYDIKTIGWDVAITEDGPVFIEGNDNWEMQTFQAIYGGLRDEWLDICRE